ncbi:hypothetical protein B0H19DRAFT_1256767 [Mycena capillaripes]|nr:hypothetical protein B0H19DRAFT_1256767 [Mycena capillaripes]
MTKHAPELYFKKSDQILHCLRNKVVGGASLFVDAFHAAAALRTQDPMLFEVLATTPVPFHINDGHHLHHTHPTIELSPTGVISQINYSPPFQAPLLLNTPSTLSNTPPSFYIALAAFADLLQDSARVYQYTQKEGDAVIFDDRRALHARTAFSNREEKDGEPNRWLKGCYFEADALLDRGRGLRKGLL